MGFFIGRESGYGAASLLGVVSLVAASGIYLHNQESNRAASLIKKEKVRSQADMDLYSALAISSSLFKPSEKTIPTIYPLSVIMPQSAKIDPMQTKIKIGQSEQSKTKLWKGSGSKLNDLKIEFKLPTVDNFDEQDWENIAKGKPTKTSNRNVLVTIDRVGVEKTENNKVNYIDSLHLKASLSDGSGSNFQKKALVYLPEPPSPVCKTNYSDKSRGGMAIIPISSPLPNQPRKFRGEVTIGVYCSSVISDVELSGHTATCKIEKQPWKDAGFINHYEATERLVLQVICEKPGRYKPDEIKVAGIMDPPVDAGGDFLIVGSGGGSPTNPPSSPPASTCRGKKYGNYCYYLGGKRQSCNSVCSSRGGYDQAGTSWINNSSRCRTILRELGKGGSYKGKWSGNQAGCKYFTGTKWASKGKSGVWITPSVNGKDTGMKSFGYDQRACACNK